MSLGVSGASGAQSTGFFVRNPFFTSSSNQSRFSFNEPLFQSPEEAAEREAEQNRPRLFSRNDRDRFGLFPRRRSPFGPITTIVTRGGRRLEELDQLQQAGPQGGTSASVTNGNLSLQNSENETLSVEEGEFLTFQRQEDGSVRVTNDSTDQSLTIQPDSSLRAEGTGTLNLFGDSRLITVSGGGSLQFSERNGETLAANPSSVETLELGSTDNSFRVSSRRSNQTDSLTLFSNDGLSISFEQGESGSIQRNDDGSVTVTNDTQSRSVTFESDATLDVLGEGEGILTSSRTGQQLDFTKGQDFQLSEADNQGILVTNESSLDEITISEGEPVPDPEGPVQFQFFESPEARTRRALNENIIRGVEENRRTLEQRLQSIRERRAEEREEASRELQDRTNRSRRDNDENSPFGLTSRNRFRLGDRSNLFSDRTTNQQLEFRNRFRDTQNPLRNQNRFTQNQLFNRFSPLNGVGFNSRLNFLA